MRWLQLRGMGHRQNTLVCFLDVGAVVRFYVNVSFTATMDRWCAPFCDPRVPPFPPTPTPIDHLFALVEQLQSLEVHQPPKHGLSTKRPPDPILPQTLARPSYEEGEHTV